MMNERETESQAAETGVLSFAEERFWFLQQLDPSTAAYNVHLLFRLSGPLSQPALAASVDRLIARHEILRSRYRCGPDGVPFRVIEATASCRIEVEDATGGLAAVRARALELGRQPLDLARGPLCRFTLFRAAEELHYLLLVTHHIVCDEGSVPILQQELAAGYGAGGSAPEVARPPVSYCDFARWQREWLDGDALTERLAYWSDALAGAPFLQLPLIEGARPRTSKAGLFEVQLPAAATARLRALARAERTTPFAVLAAGLCALLSRYTGERDVVIGTVASHRTWDELEGLIGLFLNTVALRLDLRDAPSFRELVRRATRSLLGAVANADVPFEKVVAAARASRSPGRNPLFEIVLTLETEPSDVVACGGLAFAWERLEVDNATFDLTVAARHTGDELSLAWTWRAELLSRACVEDMALRLLRLLTAAVAQPDERITALAVLDLQRPIGLAGADARTPPVDEAASIEGARSVWVHEAVARRAAEHPASIAVRCGDRALDYQTLDRRANAVACELVRRGVRCDHVVALGLARSCDWVVGALGVLKAGAAYLTVDPGEPTERRQRLLADADACAVLTIARDREAFAQWTCVTLDDEALVKGVEAPPRGEIHGEQLAYVIFTSGSTGRAKAVGVTHRGLAALVRWHLQAFSIRSSDRATQIASSAFDASVWELWPYLAVGACVDLVVDDEVRASPERLRTHWARQGTTVGFAPTSLLAELLESPVSLRLLLTGGEALHLGAPAPDRPRLVNNYGPTECTVVALSGEVAPGTVGAAPLGGPIDAVRAYVLGPDLEPLGTGMVGELWIAGPTLARGYLGDPALTAERFMPDPFDGTPGQRMYRTGDRVRWRDHGALEYVGRSDRQLKIRSVRIEPGEIEAALREHPGVADALVLAVETGAGERVLAGFATARQGADVSSQSLRHQLSSRVPAHLVPAHLEVIDGFALNRSGKRDLAPLQARVLARHRRSPGRDRTPTEEILAAIWEELLPAVSPGPTDDFFELGGHSLLATRLLSRVRTDLGAEISLREFFAAPTLEGLAAKLIPAPEDELPLTACARPAEVPLSFAQSRLWFMDRVRPDHAFYNIPEAVRLRGELDQGALRWALDEIVRRHEALRTTFIDTPDGPRQRIGPPFAVAVPVNDDAPDELGVRLRAAADRPFDLARGPLIRMEIFRLGPDDHVLLLSLHHIVADGWSMGVLARELTVLYAAHRAGAPSPLSPLPIQYADFSEWERASTARGALEPHLAYWRDRLVDGPAPLELPIDFARPRHPQFRGAAIPVSLPGCVVRAARTLCRQERATLYIGLLTGFQVLLRRYAGQPDISVGSAIAHRNRPALEPLIGFFVNMLVMRTQVDERRSFRQLVREVRETALDAYAHQDAPFEQVVEALGLERVNREPFDAIFVLQNAAWNGVSLPGIDATPVPVEHTTSKYDLLLSLHEVGDGVAGYWEYNTELFLPETVRQLDQQFGRLVAALVADPDAPIHRAPFVTDAERAALLDGPPPIGAPPEEPLHRIVEAQASHTPGAEAVICGDLRLSYQELDIQANRLAHALIAAGVRPHHHVGVLLDRAAPWPVAVLAIWKAGAGCVPLDPELPDQRLALMAADASVRAIVSSGALRSRLASVPCVEIDAARHAAQPTSRPDIEVPADAVAYLIYTSGSTGTPKGVAVAHRHAVAMFHNTRPMFAYGPADVWAVFHSFTFDFTVMELWGALLHGGRAVLVGDEDRRSPERLHALLRRERVTVLCQTPSAFRAFLPADERAGEPLGLRLVVLGGESLDPAILAGWFRKYDDEATRVINIYGPTETTVTATCCRVRAGDVGCSRSIIGAPHPGVTAYVVDDRLALVPVGAVGELCVGGAGVTLGYLGRPAITATRFVPDPYGSTPGARMYRTGDRVRRLRDGRLEFLGRADGQVKIRGFRIELGEVEAALRDQPGVGDAVVVPREDTPGDPRLVAYVVPRPSEADAATHVDDWRALYDDVYGRAGDPAEPGFDVVGWHSSYTGAAFPPDEMREWVEATRRRILALAPRDVLEIGCGTGLLLFGIAERCRTYLGTDLSPVTIDRLRHRTSAAGLGNVHLCAQEADDFGGIAPRSVDTIVLNSVSQYFPSADYLGRVVRGAIEAVADGGAVFVGDVRSHELLEVFHASVELQRAPAASHAHALARRVRTQVALETELAVAPELFAQVARESARPVRVEVHHKRGTYQNEMTRFRYDVVLRVGGRQAQQFLDWQDWGAGWTVDRVREALAAGPPALGLRGVPNARVAADVLARALLARGELTAAAIRQRCAAADGVDPEALWQIAAGIGYRAQIGWIGAGARDTFDVLFAREAGGFDFIYAGAGSSQLLDACSNRPLGQRATGALIQRLRDALVRRLPAHEVPAAFVVMDELPRTISGKLDVRALPAPDHRRAQVRPTATATEHALAAIWREVLGLEQVGADEDFFELGGHSLLMAQVASRLKRRCGLELPLRALFDARTIEALARRIDLASGAAQDRSASDAAGDAGEPRSAPVTEQTAPRAIAAREIPRRRRHPLSFVQERFWFMDQVDPGKPWFNLPIYFRLRGPLHVDALERAIETVVQRHEPLRTQIVVEGGEPRQVVAPQGAPIEHVSLDALDPAERSAGLARLAAQELDRAFDLARELPFRAVIVRLLPDDHALLATVHHIAVDGWSLPLVAEELAAAYAARAAGRPPALPELPFRYVDFAEWQREPATETAMAEGLAYWTARLATAPAPAELPTDHRRGAAADGCARIREYRVPGALRDAATELARREGATLFMVLLAAWKALVHRASGATDIVVGSPIASRTQPELERMVGCFVNTVALRTDLSGRPSFRALIQRVRETALGAYEHQDVPLERVMRATQTSRNTGREPLFRILFALAPPSADEPVWDGLAVSRVPLPEGDNHTPGWDVGIHWHESAAGLGATVLYRIELFERDTVDRVMQHFERLLAAAVAQPERAIDELDYLSAAERRALVAPPPAPGSGELLHALIEVHAVRAPDRIAVSGAGGSLSYGELWACSGVLADQLRGRGLAAEERVAVYLDPCPERVVAMLAILRAGGAFVALDPAYRSERLSFVIDDARARMIVTDRRLREDLPEPLRSRALCLDEPGPPAPAMPPPRIDPDQLAYVLYTSGSTGVPKAAALSHRAICEQLRWSEAFFGIRPDDAVLHICSIGFDVAIMEVFAPLTCGARLAIGGADLGRDVAGLARFIADEQVTISVGLIQPLLQALVASPGFDGCRSLRHVVQGGEALLPATRDEFVRRSRAVLHNAYGATEIAIDGTCASFGPSDLGKPVSIGREIGGLSVYVLDDRLHPVPIGVTGEIYFAGAKLARGYWDRPALTAEAFLPDPFTHQPGQRMYRTGDLARRRGDGALEFLGRRDGQVKIRGFRVELGDIEATLALCPGVRQVRVIKTDAEQLAAYAVADPGITPEALREFVRGRLPPYMVPAAVHLLDALPTLPSGKLDVRALPQHPIAPPREVGSSLTATEQRLAALWRDQLGTEDIAAHDDFFALGGHSLLLISLQAAILEAFGRDVAITELIAAPSLRAMATLVADATPTAAAEPEAAVARRDAMRSRRRRSELAPDPENDDGRI